MDMITDVYDGVNNVLGIKIIAGDNNIGNVDIVTIPSITIGTELPAGTKVIGSTAIDQTTDGTTNKVQARNATHDNFNANANLQVGDADVANGNPVPIDVRSIQVGSNIIGKTIPSDADGDEKFTETNPAFIQLTGSNTRKAVIGTILIGTGAAHSAGDVVSTDAGENIAFACTNLVAGGGGIILDSVVTLNQNAVFANGAGYTLYLFNTNPTVQADNAVFNLDSVAGYIGKINISTLIGMGDYYLPQTLLLAGG